MEPVVADSKRNEDGRDDQSAAEVAGDRLCDGAAQRGDARSGPRSGPPIDLSRLSHELRTPLSAIATLSEILRDERLGPLNTDRYRGYAADIHESARQALRILSVYLEAGTSGGNVPLEYVELDPGALIDGCVSALTPLAERAGLQLGIDRPGALPHLIADRRALRQIVDNLITNALRHTAPGGTITVRLSYRPGEPLVLSIVDTGDGMSEAELARARSGIPAPEPIRRRSGGTGIGLPLVHALALSLGATLTIDSRLRQGTSVTLTFPNGRLVPV